MGPFEYHRIYAQFEQLEVRTMLAGDLVGSYAASAEMIVDGNATSVPAEVDSGVQLGEAFYFLAQDHIGDYEVWKTDGTKEGTERVTEIYGNLPIGGHFWRCCNIGEVGGRLYFVIDRVAHGFKPGLFHWWIGPAELWTSDGTETGTIHLADLNDQMFAESILGSHFDKFQGNLLLTTAWSYSSDTTSHIWLSDGTLTGTQFYYEARAAFISPIQQLVPYSDKYYFLGFQYDPARLQSSVHGLWATNPETRETTLIKEFRGSDIDGEVPTDLTVANGLLLFSADGGRGQELFRSDGTTFGTRQVHDIAPGNEGANVRAITSAAGGVIFFANDGSGEQVWFSDGTEEATVPLNTAEKYQVQEVRSLEDGSRRMELRRSDAYVGTLYESSDVTLFYRYQEETRYLWATTGDIQDAVPLGPDLSIVGLFNGFVFVTDSQNVYALNSMDLSLDLRVEMPHTTLSSDPIALSATGEGLFYVSEASRTGHVLRKGELNPQLLPDRDLVVYDQGDQLLTESFVFNNQRYVFGQRGLMKWNTVTHDWTLLIENETYAKDRSPLVTSREWVSVRVGDDAVYLLKQQGREQMIVWKTDGTLDGTITLGTIAADPSHANLTGFVPQDRYIYYLQSHIERDGEALSYMVELWRLNTTSGESERTNRMTFSSNGVSSLNRLGETILLSDGRGGLWRANDELTEPRLVKQFDVDSNVCCSKGPDLNTLTVVGDIGYFMARDLHHGAELWMTDGTAEGTRIVSDIQPGSESSLPRHLTAAGNRLFFAADDGVNGTELWVTDGTQAGTQLAVDIRPGRNPSHPSELTVWGDDLVFAANDGQHGRELWKISLAVDEVLGDANGDGVVGFADFLVLSANFGKVTGSGAQDGDFDDNGVVDFDDFLLLTQNYETAG